MSNLYNLFTKKVDAVEKAYIHLMNFLMDEVKIFVMYEYVGTKLSGLQINIYLE
jgi:hypothetical protein